MVFLFFGLTFYSKGISFSFLEMYNGEASTTFAPAENSTSEWVVYACTLIYYIIMRFCHKLPNFHQLYIHVHGTYNTNKTLVNALHTV